MQIMEMEQGNEDIGELIASTARAVFAEAAPMACDDARTAAESMSWYSDGWNMLKEAGFIQAMRREEDGGVGISAAMTIVRLSGGAALALPLAEAMGADWLLAAAGLPPAKTPTLFAPVFLTLTKNQDRVHVEGEIASTPWGRACDLVCVGQLDRQTVLVTLGRSGFTVAEGVNMADEPRDKITVNALVQLSGIAPLPAGFDRHLPHRLGAVLRAVQLAGAAEAAVEMTLEYARERKQFGRELSRFQAVQQLLAILAGEAAAAKVAADVAACALVNGLPMEAVATTKIRAGEAAGRIAAAAHQIHGAIGFTREHKLQLLTRRLWSWRNEFGTESDWAIALGHSLATREQSLWPAITDFLKS